MKPVSFLSFDIEALPGRAEKDHVDRLIWGRLDSKEYGVRKICEILKDYNLKGNFLLDLSACALYGDKPIADVGKYILSEGHELHVHLHSEWLVRSWGIKGHFDGPPGLNQLDEEINRSCVEYSYFKFQQLFGRSPEVLRGGGFTFNSYTVTAARDAGFKCLSNFNSQRHADMLTVGDAAKNNEPFSWGGGLVELPVDLSPEPLSIEMRKYLDWFDRVLDRKKTKTFNLTMHSWSLLKREGPYFDHVAPEHELKLRSICEHLSEKTRVAGYSEYIDNEEFMPVHIDYFNKIKLATFLDQELLKCNICSAKFVAGNDDICPGCGGRARHRQVFDALIRHSNPFDGKRVLACFANSVERVALLSKAKELKVFDVRPLPDADFQMDIQKMDLIDDASFDGFLALHVLNHVRDDHLALREIFRILRPGGTAIITIPYRVGEPTVDMENIIEHYGAENYEKYGVGSYRRYGLDSALGFFSELFEVLPLDGFDPITGQHMLVFRLLRPVC